MKKYILPFFLLITGARMADAQCTANAGPNQTLTCLVPSATLQGSSNVSGATYLWSGPNAFSSILQNPVVAAAGVYTLIITDPANGCTATSTATVYENQSPPAINVQVSNFITCATPTVTIFANATPPGVIYSWSGPFGFSSQQQNAIVSNAGLYTVTVTNPSNGCTATATAPVGANTTIPLAGATGGTITCATPEITLMGSTTGQGNTFHWTGPGITAANQNIQDPQVNIPGQYTLTVTNPANGCSSSATAAVLQDITPPDVSATGGTITCTNPAVTLMSSSTSPNAVFVWIGPGGFTSTLQNPTANNSGDYTVVVTTPNGCTASAVATVALGPGAPTSTAIITTPDCFGLNQGAIDITPGGGTPGYTFNWSGPNGFTTTQEDISSLPAGNYSLTLTDASSCSVILTYTIAGPAAIQVPANQTTIIPITCFGDTNGRIAIAPVGGTAPYGYSWAGPNGFIASNTNILDDLAAGVYNLTITDNKGCLATKTFTVSGPSATLVITNTFVCDKTISVAVSGGTGPYQYFWSDGESGPAAHPQQDGTYHVTVTDANNCSVEETVILSSAGTTPCTRVVGQITWDKNANCLADSGETGLSAFFLKAIGANGTFYGLSDAGGHYSISLLPGAYTVTLIAKTPTSLICDNDVAVNLAATGEVATVDFLIQHPMAECAKMTVDLNASILRRCALNNYYYLKYCNEGPVKATGAYVMLKLDSLMTIDGAQKSYTALGNNTFRFELGTVQPGECGTFWVRVIVACTAVLGQIHCSEARIYPDFSCEPPDPMWSGALVEVVSQCAGDSLHFILKNTGSAPMSQPLDYIVIEDGIMSLQGTGPALEPNGTMIVSVPANGATWRIEAKQEPLSPVLSKPILSVEGCSNTGSFSMGYVNQFALNDADPWIDINCAANVGSYDPNDKQAVPTGFGIDHYIRPGTELEYKIRFQNTGTDTAFLVVIRDTLSPWLDPLTIRPGVSSHPYQFQLAAEGILIFDFQNIMLPDSNVNEPESHGFVQFRVNPRSDVPLETDIFNQAAIYFDFNDPVITNTTAHRIGENFVSVGLWQPQQPAYTVQVAPNPLEQSSRITVDGVPAQGHYRLEVVDAIGRRVRNLSADTPAFLLRKDALAEGVYLFRIALEGQLIGSGKLVVK